MPVRKITNAGSRKRIGCFPSVKLGRMVGWESPLEQDYIYYLELDPSVKFYEEQPLRIEFGPGTRFREYTPDFLVERGEEHPTRIVEVKPDEKLKDPKTVERLELARAILEARGYEYVIVTDVLIRKQPRLSNLKFLYRFTTVEVTPQLRLACLELASIRADWSIRDMRQKLAPVGFTADELYALIQKGLLIANLDKAITDQTTLTLREERLLALPAGS